MTREQVLKITAKGIKDFRRRRNITQSELASMLGVSGQNVSNMERGISTPSVDGMFALAENGATLEELFGDALASKIGRRPESETPLEKARIVKQGLQELLGMLNDGMKEGL